MSIITIMTTSMSIITIMTTSMSMNIIITTIMTIITASLRPVHPAAAANTAPRKN